MSFIEEKHKMGNFAWVFMSSIWRSSSHINLAHTAFLCFPLINSSSRNVGPLKWAQPSPYMFLQFKNSSSFKLLWLPFPHPHVSRCFYKSFIDSLDSSHFGVPQLCTWFASGDKHHWVHITFAHSSLSFFKFHLAAPSVMFIVQIHSHWEFVSS